MKATITPPASQLATATLLLLDSPYEPLGEASHGELARYSPLLNL